VAVGEDAHAEDALVRRIGNGDEVVGTEVETARRRPLVEYANNLEMLGAHADLLADRIDPERLEEHLVGRITEDGDVFAILQLGAVEVAARQHRNARAVGEVLGGPENDLGPRLL